MKSLLKSENKKSENKNLKILKILKYENKNV
jgi:hypothetical protein